MGIQYSRLQKNERGIQPFPAHIKGGHVKDAPACKDMPTIEGRACAPLQAHQIVIGEHKPYRVCAQRLDQKIPKVDSGRKQYFPARVFHLSFSPKCIVAVC